MQEKDLVQIAGFLEETATNVRNMDFSRLQMTLSELQDVNDQLMSETFEPWQMENGQIADQLKGLTVRCMDLCLERLLVQN